MSTPHESGFKIGRFEFKSRLIIGTGKYESFEQNLECAEASGGEGLGARGENRVEQRRGPCFGIRLQP